MQSLAVQERILGPREWQAVIQALETYPPGAKKERLTFLVTILFFTGPKNRRTRSGDLGSISADKRKMVVFCRWQRRPTRQDPR